MRTLLASCCVAVTAISGASLFTQLPPMLGVTGNTATMLTVRSPIIMRAIPMLIITPIHLTLTRTAIDLTHIVAMAMPVLDGPGDIGGNVGRRRPG